MPTRSHGARSSTSRHSRPYLRRSQLDRPRPSRSPRKTHLQGGRARKQFPRGSCRAGNTPAAGRGDGLNPHSVRGRPQPLAVVHSGNDGKQPPLPRRPHAGSPPGSAVVREPLPGGFHTLLLLRKPPTGFRRLQSTSLGSASSPRTMSVHQPQPQRRSRASWRATKRSHPSKPSAHACSGPPLAHRRTWIRSQQLPARCGRAWKPLASTQAHFMELSQHHRAVVWASQRQRSPQPHTALGAPALSATHGCSPPSWSASSGP